MNGTVADIDFTSDSKYMLSFGGKIIIITYFVFYCGPLCPRWWWSVCLGSGWSKMHSQVCWRGLYLGYHYFCITKQWIYCLWVRMNIISPIQHLWKFMYLHIGVVQGLWMFMMVRVCVQRNGLLSSNHWSTLPQWPIRHCSILPARCWQFHLRGRKLH